MNKYYRIVTVTAVLFLSACAPPAPIVRERFFWPPPPNEPKIEFVAAYHSADDFPPTFLQRFIDATVGHTPAPGLEKPWGIASTGEGIVYVVDTGLRGVIIFDLKKHTVDALGGGDYSGFFRTPAGIALDGQGNVYVSDPPQNKVYSFTKSGKPLRFFGRDNTLNWPVGMVIDNVMERLYVVNGKGHNISVFDLTGEYLFTIGSRGDGDGEFNFPTDIDIDSKGNLVVADSLNARVQIFDPDGKLIRKFGQRGDGEQDFQIIKGIAVSRDDHIYVVDGMADRVLVFDIYGEPLTSIGWTAVVAENLKLNPGGFMIPQDIDIDGNDTVFVVDSINKRFQMFQIIDEMWLKSNPIKQ